MKTEFLKNFKVGEQELPKEIIDAIMAENGRDVEAAKKPFADYDTIKQSLADANKTIEGFEEMDVDGIQNAAKEWKDKYETAQREHEQKLTDMAFESLLTGAVTQAKGRNAKAISALLDMDTLKASKNQEADIQAALDTLKTESGYLFDTDATPPPYAPGPGTQTQTTKYTPEVNAIRAAAGLKTE